jgi:hypothetical protein
MPPWKGWGKIPGPEQPRQLHSIAPVRLDSVARLLGNARRGHHPTFEILLGQVPIQPVPARPRFVDQVQRLALRLQLADQFVEVALPGPDRPQEHDLRFALLPHVGNREALLMDSQPDKQCATLCPG